MVIKHSPTALPLLLLVVAVLPATFVYAQTNTTTTTTPEEETTTTANTTANATTSNATTTTAPIQQLVTPSTAAQQIINNTQAECVQAQFFPRQCVILVYESPTTVVLNGEVLIFGGTGESMGNYPNSFLWRAVDGFKAQGYIITTIGMSGAGTRVSPNEFHVIMSK
jgi:hypothetical protein